MFWNRGKTKEGELRLPSPKNLPQQVAAHLVVVEKQDPNVVWNLKGVVRPAGKEETFYCRIFSAAQAAEAGVKIKDWTSLDDQSALILWEGYFDTETKTVRREKFAKPSGSSN